MPQVTSRTRLRPAPQPYRLPGGTLRQTLALVGRGMRDAPRSAMLGIGASVVYGVAAVGSGLLLGRITDHVITPAVNGEQVPAAQLWWAGAALLAVGLVTAAGIAGRRVWAGKAVYEIQAAHRLRVTRSYLRLPMSWHRRHPAGRLLSNANADAEAAAGVFMSLPYALGVVAMLAVASIAMLLADPLIGLVGVTVLPVVVVANAVFRRAMAPRVAATQRLRAEVADVAHESFEAALLVKSLGTEAVEERRFDDVTQELAQANIAMGKVRSTFDPVIEFLPTLATFGVIVVGAWQVQRGVVATGTVIMIAYLLTIMTFPVRAIGFVLAEIPRSIVGHDRISYVIDTPVTMHDGPREATGDGGAELRLESVGLEVPARVMADDAPAAARGRTSGTVALLSDVDLHLPAGRTLAVVGHTGAGKTTLAHVAARLMDPTTGRVLLDGTDIRELSQGARTGQVALVSQSTFVFDDTVRGNVTLGADIDDDAVWQALRTARADGFIAGLPGGLDAFVGERGTTLSGGQRQRLAIARALVRRPHLLILDDATSAVDPVVEREILTGLGATTGEGVTVLIVAYRAATIALADHVLHLERGRVVDTGSHAELMTRDPGYVELATSYARRAAEQQGGLG